MAGHAVVFEHGRARGDVSRRRGSRRRRGRVVSFAFVLRAGSLTGRRCGTESAVEPQQPEVVAVRCGGERVAAGQERDVLLAVLLEDRCRVVRAGARLEAPEEIAARRVVRL